MKRLKWNSEREKFVCNACSAPVEHMTLFVPYKFDIEPSQHDAEKAEYELLVGDYAPSFMLCKCGAMYHDVDYDLDTTEDYLYMVSRKDKA